MDVELGSPAQQSPSSPSTMFESMSSRLKTAFTSTIMRSVVDEYDYCVVFPTEEGELVPKRGAKYMHILQLLGFEMYVFRVELKKAPGLFARKNPSKNGFNSDKEVVVYALIRAPDDKLREYAERYNLVMELDPEMIRKVLEEGDAERNISPIKIRHEPEVSSLHPYDYIFAPYKQDRESLYLAGPRRNANPHVFKDLLRLKLLGIILESRPRYTTAEGVNKSGENLKVARYLKNEWLLGVFPLHDPPSNLALYANWRRYPFSPLPSHQLKEYIGEKLGLYFVFLDFYTKALLWLCIGALPFQIAAWSRGDSRGEGDSGKVAGGGVYMAGYALILACWAIAFHQYWIRHEKYVALRWGAIGFEAEEHDRPEFKGKEAVSHIDGKLSQYFSSRKRGRRVLMSIAATAGLILLVVGTVAGIYLMRLAVSPEIGDGAAQTLASLSNALLIQFLNTNALSEWENHRTDTDFEDSLIAKIFIFQFVNSYSSFFYLAFLAERVGDCPDLNEGGCMPSLTSNLGVIYATRLISGTIISKVVLPYFAYKWRQQSYRGKLYDRRPLTLPEKQNLRDTVDVLKENFDNYGESILQFGYTALFASALPIATFYSLMLNIAVMRVNAWQYLKLKQRPSPKGAEDIGSWLTILQLLAVFSVVTNAGIIVFTMHSIGGGKTEAQWGGEWGTFVYIQWACFILQGIIAYLIPDNPEEVRVQLKRSRAIVDKVINRLPDDVNGYMPHKEFSPPEIRPLPQEVALHVYGAGEAG
eukprot:gene34701-42020_t